MRSSRSVILPRPMSIAAALIPLLLVGCQPPPKPLPPPPAPEAATPEQANQVQVDLSTFGAAKIGRVGAVDATNNRASITGIPDKDAKLGDVISILDGTAKVVANGTITLKYADKDSGATAIVITYEIAAGGRAPMKDDLAVTQLPAK